MSIAMQNTQVSNLKNSFPPFDAALIKALQRNVTSALEEDVGSCDFTGELVSARQGVNAQVMSFQRHQVAHR